VDSQGGNSVAALEMADALQKIPDKRSDVNARLPPLCSRVLPAMSQCTKAARSFWHEPCTRASVIGIHSEPSRST